MDLHKRLRSAIGIEGRAKFILLAVLVMAWQLAGWPQLWHLPTSQQASAATFTMQTGYYIGSGAALTVSGLNFQPNLVIIKADTAAGSNGAVWKSSAMPAADTAFLSVTAADDTSTMITLNSDGFSVSSNADVSAAAVRYTYTAFAGSNCSSSGTFCVGSYSGNGTSGKAVTTGFQPDMVWVKKSAATNQAAAWRSSAMGTNVTQFFGATTQVTTNADFQSLTSTGFTVGTGAVVNTSGSNYWFVAFKKVAGTMNVGSFTGTSVAQSITGMGFSPNAVMFKNANDSTAAQAAGYNLTQSDGDDSSSFMDVANTTGNVTSLDANGFSVGTSAPANNSGNTIYWVGFGGSTPASGSGNFSMANGTFTGNGTGQSVTGLGFSPSLVIIGTDSQDKAFRTSEMKGDDTAVFSNGTADFTGGITSLDSDGFTVGASTVTNSSAATYYWTAFGGAWNPETHTGSSDFAVGAYTGNGIARSVLNLPFAPDMIVDKSENTNAGVWSTSGMADGTTQFFAATAQNTAGAEFASLNTNSFSIGTNATVNGSGKVYNWFAFKSDGSFSTGSYTGNGTAGHAIASGFQPDLAWTKRTTAVVGSGMMSSIPAGTSLRFGANTNSTTDFTNLTSSGFTLGNGAEANTSGGTYWYVTWQGKTYGQSAYRLFENTDSTDVGAPLAAQNAAATLRSTNRPFRLRMLLQIAKDTLFAAAGNFKLQYAQLNGTCAASSYSNVTSSSIIAYNNNPTPNDGDALTTDANDPTDAGNAAIPQDYDEANNFTNAQAAIQSGQDGEWDFSLKDNGAPPNAAYCFRAVKADGSLLDSYTTYPEIITSDGVFSTDVVDHTGTPVASPSVAMSTAAMSFRCTTSTGTLGTNDQRIRVTNRSAGTGWSLAIAATDGNTALWSNGSAVYDFNDPSGSPPGCAAGGDGDTYAGLLSLNFDNETVTPESDWSGCTTTGLSNGSNASFDEGVTDNIQIGQASSLQGAPNGCYWDFQNIGLNQQIPVAQSHGNYSLSLTVTLVAD